MIDAAMLCTFTVVAEPAKSTKQAKNITQYRQAIFKLVKSNVGVDFIV
jgi:hypothetical protein